MRALLIVNPHATSTTPAGRDVLAAALASQLKLDMVTTTHRGHAARLAEQATSDGLDLVVVHGGDGTVNEVVNGLLAASEPLAGPALATAIATLAVPAIATLAVPAIAVVPGGSGNVFGAGIGIPRDPVEATSHLLRALRSGRRRTIGLGRLHGWKADTGPVAPRWFTFNAGLGLDADAVRRVERARAKGRRATTARYIHAALRSYVQHDHRHPRLTVELPGGGRVTGVFLAIVASSDPYSFVGDRPVRMNPGCTQDNGLGLFALRSLAPLVMLRHVTQMLRRTGRPHGKHLISQQDLPWVTVSSEVPVGLQVDGEFLGEHVRAGFESVPAALSVVV